MIKKFDMYDILGKKFFHDAPKYRTTSMESTYWSSIISPGIDYRNGDSSNLCLWKWEK